MHDKKGAKRHDRYNKFSIMNNKIDFAAQLKLIGLGYARLNRIPLPFFFM